MELQEMIQEVKVVLSPKRFAHSIGVMKRIKELAVIYGIDEQIVQKIAITHDIAKEMKEDEMLQYIKENNIKIDEIERETPSLLHGKIAADITRKKYFFSKEMQDAICYHTVGNPKMDKLAKLLFVADKTEENRKHIDLARAVEIANYDLDLSVISLLEESIEYTMKKGGLIHPDSILTRNTLLMKRKKQK